MKRVLINPTIVLFFITVIILSGGCSKIEIKTNTTDDVNMVGYLDKHLDSFSLFRQILTRTNTADYLNAYGNYTLFAVTNSGVKKWLAARGAANIDAVAVDVLNDLVRFHLVEDTLSTSSFTDGKMAKPTMFGQYLITSVVYQNGESKHLINRNGYITQSNIRVGNGYIHAIDNVLKPATLSLAKQLEADSKYSIFLEAVKETGYYGLLDSINTKDSAMRWITLLAESNAALADSGITTYAQLRSRYSNSGNPAILSDTLNLYVRYHIIPSLKFLADLAISTSQETLAPQEVVSVKLIGQDVYVNDDIFNGAHEPGILLQRPFSDLQATNGVLHDAKSHFAIKYRIPSAVYWDVSAFDEIVKLPAYYGKASYTFIKATDADRPIKDIDWMFSNGKNLQYFFSKTDGRTSSACNYDLNIMELGPSARPRWVDYRTPAIIKGRYKVWICYRQQKGSSNSTLPCNVYINGNLMTRSFAFTDTRPGGNDGELEAINYKRYTETTANSYVGRCVGIVDIPTTARHMLRIEAISGGNSTNNLDMVHFIPINQNQYLPRFKPDGTMIYY